jgi:hypothetical protein
MPGSREQTMTKNITAEQPLRVRILARLANGSQESGVAMLSAILFMIIMAGLGTVIVGTILGQVTPTYNDQKQTQTVYAAQAGMQAALGRFRTATLTDSSGVVQVDATTGATIGDPTKLPCSIEGDVDPSGANDGLTYKVTITYYYSDPTFQSSSWQTSPANQIPCVVGTAGASGSGVQVTSAHPVRYALLSSVGAGPALPGTTDASTGNRALGAVYQFKATTVNIAGGLINDYNDGGAYCLEAAAAMAGQTISFVPASQCTAANSALELWSYGSDYEIKLASTTVNAAAGLCITGPTGANATTTTATQNALLEPCIAATPTTGTTRWSQLWSWFGDNTWQGSNPAINALGSYYLSWQGSVSGALLQVSTSESNGFSPSTAVGAGAAGHGNEEIVNYKEFGRCMDIADQQVSEDMLISYPCKQDPTNAGKNITWNQKFYYNGGLNEPATTSWVPGSGQLIVNSNTPSGGRAIPATAATMPSSSQYCIITAGYPATKPVSGTTVMATPCTTGTQDTEWTRVYSAATYGQSYTFTTTTSAGVLLCLQPNSGSLYKGWSILNVATCDTTSLAQKWNAPPNYSTTQVGGYKEIGG